MPPLESISSSHRPKTVGFDPQDSDLTVYCQILNVKGSPDQGTASRFETIHRPPGKSQMLRHRESGKILELTFKCRVPKRLTRGLRSRELRWIKRIPPKTQSDIQESGLQRTSGLRVVECHYKTCRRKFLDSTLMGKLRYFSLYKVDHHDPTATFLVHPGHETEVSFTSQVTEGS